MATLTVTDIERTGVDPAGAEVAAAAGGDEFANDGKTFFRANNASAGSITVTFATVATQVRIPGFGEIALSNLQVSVPAGAVREIGPFPTGQFNDNGGKVQVTYSGVTSLTVAARRVPVGE